jgi:hypothetical protein
MGSIDEMLPAAMIDALQVRISTFFKLFSFQLPLFARHVYKQEKEMLNARVKTS